MNKLKSKKFHNLKNKHISAIIVILIVTILGVSFLLTGRAQSPFSPVETESGILTTPANILNDSTASGSASVLFGTNLSSIVGAYSGYENIAGSISIGTQLGHPIIYETQYLDYRNTINGWASTGQGITNPTYISNWQSLQTKNGTNLTMVWGLPMLPNVSLDPVTGTTTNCLTTPATCWAQGVNGDYNSYFVKVAQSLVKYGQSNSIIRIGWEFNSKNFIGPNPWYAASYSTQFGKYWQNIVTSMRSVSGQKFIFDWNESIGANTIPDFLSYYPGDSYVDAIGLDVYDNAWLTYPGAQTNWNRFLDESQGLNWLVTFGNQHKKPLTLPEWGLGWTDCSNGVGQVIGPTCPTGSVNSGNVSGGDNSYFVQQIANYLRSNNFIEAGVWSFGVQPIANSSKMAAPNATAEFIKDFK